MKRLMLVAAMCVTAAPAMAERQWFSDFNMGSSEMSIRNDDGSTLAFTCGSGTDEMKASFSYQSKLLKLPKPRNDVEVLIRTDGVDWPIADDCQAGSCSADAFNVRVLQDFKKTSEAIRKAKTLSIRVPKLKIEERFSVVGADKVLKDAFDGCE